MRNRHVQGLSGGSHVPGFLSCSWSFTETVVTLVRAAVPVSAGPHLPSLTASGLPGGPG